MEWDTVRKFKRKHKVFNNISDEDFWNIWHSVNKIQYDDYLKCIISFKDEKKERINKLFKKYDVELNENELKIIFEDYLELYKSCFVLFDDTEEVLKELSKKYKIVLLSNGDSDLQREKLKRTKIDKYFNEIIVSGDIGFSKPDKEIFEYALDKLKLNNSECLMVGDKYNTDVLGSLNANIQGVWVDRKNDPMEYEYKIKELSELINP